MKLSFSLQSKSSAKPIPKFSVEEDEDHHQTAPAGEFVTEFDPSKTLASKPIAVIPPIQNEWRPSKRMKNLQNLPTLQSDGTRGVLEFETETISATDHPDDNMSYGLNIRKGTTDDQDGDVDRKGSIRSMGSSLETLMLQKLRNDLDRLPDDRGMEEFVDRPVEGFGAALLAGYGWTEGKGIGKNAKEDTKVMQIKKHTSKEGLGYDSLANNKSKSQSTNNRSQKDDLKDKVKEKRRDDTKEEDRSSRKSKIQEEKKSSYRDSTKKSDSKRSRDFDEVKSERYYRKSDKVGNSWLRSHIRVRIISKDFKRGRFYLKKAEVLDVVDPTTCDISIDETKELIQGVDQEFLETALPRRGGPVLILSGKHKGVFGSLVEKDLDREIGVVRDADTHGLLNVGLDQIAEYVGDPSYIGY